MRTVRRNLVSLFAAALIAASGLAAAQDYPSRNLRVLLPVTPGAAADTYARIIANGLAAAWGKAAIVDARPGGTGLIATLLVKQATADGYTLLFTTNSVHITGPLLVEPRPFDAVTDFTPISMAVKFPLYLIAHPSVPARTVSEFVAYAKARPKQLNFSSSGQGGISHIIAELFNSTVGIEAVQIPYKGSAPALLAVVGGEAQYLFNNIGNSQALVLAGKLRGYAVTGSNRNPLYPDIPTFAELGIKGMEVAQTWFGLVAPAHLPPALVSKLNTEVVRIMNSPEVTKRAVSEGYEVVGNTPAQFASDMRAEVAAFSRIIKEKGIKAQ